MAEAPRPVGWLTMLSRAEPDGSHLIRPLGRAPLVFRTDAATKDRVFRFVRGMPLWSAWLTLLAGFVTANCSRRQPWWEFAGDILVVSLAALLAAVVLLCLGIVVILRHAASVPPGAWPNPVSPSKTAPHRQSWPYVILLWLVVVAIFAVPSHSANSLLAFASEAALTALAVALLVAWQYRLWRAHGVSPPVIDPARRRKRLLLGALIAPLANPFVLLALGVSLAVTPEWGHDPRALGLIFASSYACSLALGICFFLLGQSRSGMRWQLGVASVATAVLASALSTWLYGRGPHDLVLTLSIVAAAGTAFPIAGAFWFIARPEKYA